MICPATLQRSHPSSTWPRRLLALAATLASALVVVAAAAAHGGPAAGSSHYLSTIVAIEPAVPNLELRVLDRDDRLVLTNGTGEVVIVSGYQFEPYLRFDATGVWVNRHSPNRFTDSERSPSPELVLPPAADPTAQPEWTLLTTGATWEWHDHRVHWTGEGTPADAIAPIDGKIDVRDWEIGITVGARAAIVKGRLEYFVKAQGTGGNGNGSVLAIAIAVPLALLVVGGAGVVAWRRRRRRPAA